MKIFVGADHNGYKMRKDIIAYLMRAGYDVADDAEAKFDPEDDFPIIAARVIKDVLGDEDRESKGILLCASGQGMCMAANRYRGIRACLGYDTVSVRASRNDDDANVLCIPANTMDPDKINVILETFLNTKFAGAPRFSRRIQELDQLT